jgi:tetratricopeptide (TPR) repeat protein
MWSLILPPIVVIVILGLVLWYLAVRGTDPGFREAAAEIPDAPGIKTRLKAGVVRVMERIVSRSRIAFLRMHNGLTGLTRRLRERRNRYAKVLNEASSDKEVPVSNPEMIASGVTPLDREISAEPAMEDIPAKEVIPSLGDQEDFDVLTPIRRAPRATPPAEITEEKPVRKRGFFTRTVRKDETIGLGADERQRVALPPKQTEESLIARIAESPKEFSAYEALGDFYMEAGNTQDAKECYRQVLKLSPAHRSVKMKIRKLEKVLSQK